jgi:phospholipid transport system transporter-binding protein
MAQASAQPLVSAVVLPVTLTLNQANTFVLEQTKVIAAGGQTKIAVDASALKQFDSSALAVLLELRRQALAAGKTFGVTGQSQRLQDLAGLYGVAQLLGAG